MGCKRVQGKTNQTIKNANQNHMEISPAPIKMAIINMGDRSTEWRNGTFVHWW